MVLPWSGLQLTLSSRWFQDSRPQDQRLWVAPQVPVEYSARDWLANRDPVLEAVLAIVKERQ